MIDKGAGIVKHLGLQDKIDFQSGILSKAIDVVGDDVARTKKMLDQAFKVLKVRKGLNIIK